MDNQQPLLPSILHSTAKLSDMSSDEIEEFLEQMNVSFKGYLKLFAWESRLLWLLSGAVIIVLIFNYMLGFVTLMFVGHLGSLEVAGASIASVGIQGLAYGLMVHSLCQAYGTKRHAVMGVICLRAIILHLGAAFLLSFPYWFSGPLLKAIGQSETISEKGELFALRLILQLYAFAISCPMQRFLQVQNIVNPLAYIAVSVFIVHVVITWLVVDVLEYGLFGAALAQSFPWCLLIIAQGLYIVFSPLCKETWTGFNMNAFNSIWPYLKLTVPQLSCYGNCLEIWYFQGLVLVSGLLPYATISLDSISICMTYWNWDMQFMLELAAAASIMFSTILCIIVLIFRVGLSVAVGSGWQAVVAYINLGIWWGMIVGVILQTFSLFILTVRTNWNTEVEKAANRLKEAGNRESDLVESP
ncbi:unnamed protein product [Withania somnifera]